MSESARRIEGIMTQINPLQEKRKAERQTLLDHMIRSGKARIETDTLIFECKEGSKKPPINPKNLKRWLASYPGNSDAQAMLDHIKQQRDEAAKTAKALRISKKK